MKMLGRGILLLLALAGATGGAAGQTVTPARGSALRREILDALRVPVQRELGGRPVVFQVELLRVRNGWAFVSGVPRTPGGGPIDYRGTPYQEAREQGVFDDGISALLRLRNGRWTVVTYALGATDVPWVVWPEEYGAPRALFPFGG